MATYHVRFANTTVLDVKADDCSKACERALGLAKWKYKDATRIPELEVVRVERVTTGGKS